MHINNYDTSSTGTSIGLTIVRDDHLAQLYYNDFTHEVMTVDGRNGPNAYILGDVDKPYYQFANLFGLSELVLSEMVTDYTDNDEHRDDNKKQLIAELLTLTIRQYYTHIFSHHSHHSITEIITHEHFTSRGYSQGDAVYIISVDEPLDKEYRNYIGNVLWDQPIYVHAVINNVAYDAYDFLDNVYDYNKKTVIAKIELLDIATEAKEYLIDNLPEYVG